VAGVRLPCRAVGPVRGAAGLALAVEVALGLGLGGADGVAPASALPTATPIASTAAVNAALSSASLRRERGGVVMGFLLRDEPDPAKPV
jgi:hypothetical protein